MKYHNKNAKRFCQLAAVAASFVLVAFLLVSSAFIAMEAGHDCDGDDCPICSCIFQCENLLRQMHGGIFVSVIAILLLSQVFLVIRPIPAILKRDSLVNLRVRLNN